MSISAIGNSTSYYGTYTAYMTLDTQAMAAAAGSTISSGTDSNAVSAVENDGSKTKRRHHHMDSQAAQAFFGGMMQQGGTPSGSQSNELGDFLDKVKAGTVTDADLSSMQKALSRYASRQSSNSTGTEAGTAVTSDSGAAAEASSLSMEDFLDKVKSGTVTDSDLNTMKSQLASRTGMGGAQGMPPMGPPPGGPPPGGGMGGGGGKDGIASFLDKVKDGSVTDSDITALQKLLNQEDDDDDDDDDSDSDSSTSTTTTTAASASGTSSSSDTTALEDLTMSAFLEKVKNGTATEADISTMQTQLNELDQLKNNETDKTRPAGPPPGGSPPGPPPGTEQDEESDGIASFLEKVKSGTVTDDDLTNLKKLLSEKSSDDSASGTTSGTSSAATVAGTKTALTMADFLAKVKDGTVSDSDLTTMKDQLNAVTGSESAKASGVNHRHHHHHGAASGNNSSSEQSTGSDGSGTESSSLASASTPSQQLLQAMLQAYQTGSQTVDLSSLLKTNTGFSA